MLEAEDEFGPWGKLYVDDDGRTVGLIQYGPADRFPRARGLPAGPPAADAALITCAYLVDVHSPWVLQSLLRRSASARCAGSPRWRRSPIATFRRRRSLHGSSATGRSSRPTFCATSASRGGEAQAESSWRLDLRGTVPVEEATLT